MDVRTKVLVRTEIWLIEVLRLIASRTRIVQKRTISAWKGYAVFWTAINIVIVMRSRVPPVKRFVCLKAYVHVCLPVTMPAMKIVFVVNVLTPANP